jgi:hypothetical protein
MSPAPIVDFLAQLLQERDSLGVREPKDAICALVRRRVAVK